MKGVLDVEEIITVGSPILLESTSPENAFAVFFEDEGDTGYFYALDTSRDPPILDALHIYNVANVADREVPSKLQIAWSYDGLKSALIINDYFHAVFDFESKRGFCRAAFPPPTSEWTKHGHEWNDEVYNLFS